MQLSLCDSGLSHKHAGAQRSRGCSASIVECTPVPMLKRPLFAHGFDGKRDTSAFQLLSGRCSLLNTRAHSDNAFFLSGYVGPSARYRVGFQHWCLETDDPVVRMAVCRNDDRPEFLAASPHVPTDTQCGAPSHVACQSRTCRIHHHLSSQSTANRSRLHALSPRNAIEFEKRGSCAGVGGLVGDVEPVGASHPAIAKIRVAPMRSVVEQPVRSSRLGIEIGRWSHGRAV